MTLEQNTNTRQAESVTVSITLLENNIKEYGYAALEPCPSLLTTGRRKLPDVVQGI
jgi:hypothetical protein